MFKSCSGCIDINLKCRRNSLAHPAWPCLCLLVNRASQVVWHCAKIVYELYFSAARSSTVVELRSSSRWPIFLSPLSFSRLLLPVTTSLSPCLPFPFKKSHLKGRQRICKWFVVANVRGQRTLPSGRPLVRLPAYSIEKESYYTVRLITY